jgi:hypothetical protein
MFATSSPLPPFTSASPQRAVQVSGIRRRGGWFLCAALGSFFVTIAANAQFDDADNFTIGGNLGVGESTPAVKLHVSSVAQPVLRLEETSGPNQIWDVGANFDNFFVYDLTADTTPFRIKWGAPASSIEIAANGVGVGTDTPLFPLHVVRTTGTAARIAQFTQTKAGAMSAVGVENNAVAAIANQAGYEFVLKTSGSSRVAARITSNFTNITDGTRVSQIVFTTNALVSGVGTLKEAMRIRGDRVGIGSTNPSQLLQVGSATCNGTTWDIASSRKLKHDIAPLSTEAARDTVMALQPVTFAYNQDPDDQRLGFIAEDVPEAVAMPDRETLSSLDIVAALTRVVQDQAREMEAQEERLAAQQTTIDALVQRLDSIERQVTESAE